MAMNRIPFIKVGETEVHGTNITKEDYGKSSVDDQLLFDAISQVENSPFLKDELEVAKATINELLESNKIAADLSAKDVEEADKRELMAAMDSFKIGDEFRKKSAKLIESGLIEEDMLVSFLKLIDDDDNYNLSRYELQTLLRASYTEYQKELLSKEMEQVKKIVESPVEPTNIEFK